MYPICSGALAIWESGIAREEEGCGLWFTQNRIYVAGIFFTHFGSNLAALTIQMV